MDFVFVATNHGPMGTEIQTRKQKTTNPRQKHPDQKGNPKPVNERHNQKLKHTKVTKTYFWTRKNKKQNKTKQNINMNRKQNQNRKSPKTETQNIKQAGYVLYFFVSFLSFCVFVLFFIFSCCRPPYLRLPQAPSDIRLH